MEELLGYSQNVAKKTWRSGFLHLTVDKEGLVSLWDEEMTGDSYLKLPLTEEQQDLIQQTMHKGGRTP